MAKAAVHKGGAPPTTIESSRDRERLRTVVFPEHSDLAVAVAERIVEVIQRETRAKGRAVLGLATGSTPLGVYEELIRRHQAGDLDFSHVITFNLDEYYPMTPDSPHSYRRYMWENFFAHVNIAKQNVHIPDGTIPRERVADACAAYEEAIRAAGGIDFQLLGIGKTGHVGFNEPGSDATSRTRIVTLDTLTRKDAAADFFGVENVPREAITMGVATILDAREIALLATGEHKTAIVARAVEGEISTDVAATFLQRHPSVTVYLDLPAAAELTRIKTPWVLEGSVDWTPAMIERSVVWLAERSGKAVLKLPAHERVLVFSPHPDDDVISMGGILRKLWENENQIVVAYMTSGNIAVFDHDVTRHLDFVERAAGSLGLDPSSLQRAQHHQCGYGTEGAR